MKQLLLLFVFSLSTLALNAQYYRLSQWAEDLPYSYSKNEIYAIGCSDPRMTDTILAKKIAEHRAITMAILFNDAKVYYASDYFEKKSEEYRWFIMKENIEELGKIEASGWVDKSNYQIIESYTNKNGEIMVMIKYNPQASKQANFFVSGEYYRQDFELSNTRAHETLRTIQLKTRWKPEDRTDTLHTCFQMSNYNNDITTEIFYDNNEIIIPGYFYNYESNIPDSFNIINYNTSVKLLKGLWIAYIDSFMQSVLKISKNYSSKMETVQDGYKVNRNDGLTETTQESLARSVCKNTLSFVYGGMGINKNSLFPRIYLYGERPPYISYKQIEQEKADSITQINAKNKKCWLKRIFIRENKKTTNN
ncbi:MAG: hypothetical protein PHP52_08660 [Bacteroidales bacterium]|nr:hypothetical protein [Bacteroidales bacterium]MDD4216886.1 hypothetical protein [Bacteroidales bacterium]MDY0140590.1 hypothetical protein [Bacteroidales bacterium]